MLQSLVMIVNRHCKYAFGIILPDHVFIQKAFYFNRFFYVEFKLGGGSGFTSDHQFLFNYFTCMLYAIFTDMSFLARD